MNRKHKRKFLPYGHQWIDGDDIRGVVSVLKSDFLTQGQKISKFEKALADYVGAKFAVTFNSGTSAILAACFAANIYKGENAITTPYTFVATSNSLIWFGANPVFVDIEKNTLDLNHNKIEKAINKKTRAVITVDFAGLPCNYEKILKIVKKYNLILIDDASHAFGSKYKNKMIGSIADMTIFSFHPVKTITTGEGGATVTNDNNFYQKLLIFRNHGIVKNNQMKHKIGDWYYEVQNLGFNLRMTDIQASLGITQLKKIDKFIKRRREIVEIYNDAFRHLALLTPKDSEDTRAAWHLYPVRLEGHLVKRKREIFEDLHQKGIKAQVHYLPIHLHPFYKKKFGYKKGDFPISERVYKSEISLPLFPRMTSFDVIYVKNTFIDVIKKYSK